jgi:hypothetical protein
MVFVKSVATIVLVSAAAKYGADVWHGVPAGLNTVVFPQIGSTASTSVSAVTMST